MVDISSYQSTQSIADLNRIANSRDLEVKQRAEAVFSLFANHVRIAEVRRMNEVFIDSSWFAEANLNPVSWLSGWLPIRMGDGKSTLFTWGLFPTSDGPAWGILFRLSGGGNLSREQG